MLLPLFYYDSTDWDNRARKPDTEGGPRIITDNQIVYKKSYICPVACQKITFLHVSHTIFTRKFRENAY